MNCPVCTAALRSIRYESVEIHTCDGCGGEFVGPGQMVHIVNVREAKFVTDQAGPVRPAFGLPPAAQDRGLQCPSCSCSMKPRNYANDSGVLVDRCDACGGLWLDATELERIQSVLETWQDHAPSRIRSLSRALERAQRAHDTPASGAFAPSRFAFVNAIVNRILEAA